MSIRNRSEGLDPITLSVVIGSINSALREMTITMRRTAMSPVLAIGNDFSNTIADAKARMIAQGDDQPVHLGALIFATKAVAEYFGDDIYPGDVIYHNDPRTGGSHLQDMTLYRPVFVDDTLMFWTVNRSHMNETGGPVPGGYNPLAKDIWAEGLRISPVKIYERGTPRRDVIDFILTNLRTREDMRGDIGAQLAATGLAAKRLIAIVEKYGRDQVELCLDYILDRAESLMRQEITRIPNGIYHGRGIVEGEDPRPGVGDLEIRCTVEVKDDQLAFRLHSPPVVPRYVNSYAAQSTGAAYLGVLTYVDPNVPHNEGLYRPLKVDLGPENTLINAQEPAACGLSTDTPYENIVDAVRDALSKALPDRAGGAWSHHCPNSFFGEDPRHDRPYNYYMHMSGWGGGGAMVDMNGEPCVGCIAAAGAAMTGDIEMVEYRVPIHIHRYELRTDSGGPGQWRGGLGSVLDLEVVDHDAILTQFGDGMKYAAPGVLGAGGPRDDERVFEKWILRGSDHKPEKIGIGAVTTMYAGERLLCHLAGGGGVGPAFLREPEAVKSDVLNGYVSVESAWEEYGVVVDPTTLEIDQKGTEALRKEIALQSKQSVD